MIARKSNKFLVYKMNEELREWERVYDLGKKILFVTYDKCFFVTTDYFLDNFNGNCIVFPKNCFPSEVGNNSVDDDLFKGTQDNLEIGVFYMDKDCCALESSSREFSSMFWPPPLWLTSDLW